MTTKLDQIVTTLSKLARCGLVNRAAESSGVSRVSLYRLARKDPVVAMAFQVAKQVGRGA